MPTLDAPRLVVIGSGPAAYTAAIYAARAQLAPLVLEGEPSREMVPGGQLMFTTDIENFPGFANGVSGQALMDQMRAQALRCGAVLEGEQVVAVDAAARPFSITTASGRTLVAEAIIIATGARAKWLGVPNEERLARSGGGGVGLRRV